MLATETKIKKPHTQKQHLCVKMLEHIKIPSLRRTLVITMTFNPSRVYDRLVESLSF